MDQISGYNLKNLYLLRHAKSSWDYPNLADFDRPLNKRGKENLVGLANLAAMLNPTPELVLTSPSKRTLETVKGFCQGIPGLFTVVEEKKLYHATKEEILCRINKVPENIKSLLIVGHNPGLEEFISWAVMGSSSSNRLKMTTSAFVQLGINVPSWSEIAPQTATLQIMIPGRFILKL